MKHLLVCLALCLTINMSAQQTPIKFPIVIVNAGDTVITAHPNNVFIGGVIPINMTSINYYTHLYDDYNNVYYMACGYQTGTCGRFDQEFSLWVSGRTFFYTYIDNCEGFSLWRGKPELAENFRAPNLQKNYANNKKR